LLPVLKSLTEVLRRRGQFTAATELLRTMIAVEENAPDLRGAPLASAWNALGDAYRDGGRLHDAEPCYVRSLAIWRQTVGESHALADAAWISLAMLYEKLGRMTDAASTFERLVAIMDGGNRQNDPDFVAVLQNYAEALRKMKRKSEAKAVEERAQSILAARDAREVNPVAARTYRLE
jgi:tetratricopeptide (TPR) repeat protein